MLIYPPRCCRGACNTKRMTAWPAGVSFHPENSPILASPARTSEASRAHLVHIHDIPALWIIYHPDDGTQPIVHVCDHAKTCCRTRILLTIGKMRSGWFRMGDLAPYYLPNSLKSPINWSKYALKNPTPPAPLSSDPGSAPDAHEYNQDWASVADLILMRFASPIYILVPFSIIMYMYKNVA